MRRVARPFGHSDATNKVGAPLFAFCAKGGRDAACSADFDVPQIRYFKQHHTRPCQQRKDGGPTLIDRVGSSKAGPPASLSHFTSMFAIRSTSRAHFNRGSAGRYTNFP
jgi:hypothetical protein